MLPRLRLVVAAISATILLVVIGFSQLVKLQVAQTRSASLPPPESRFAGLAFAERADWTPDTTGRLVSLEQLPPFAKSPTTFRLPPIVNEPPPVQVVALPTPLPPQRQPDPAVTEPPIETPATVAPPAETAAVTEPHDEVENAINSAPTNLTPSSPPPQVEAAAVKAEVPVMTVARLEEPTAPTLPPAAEPAPTPIVVAATTPDPEVADTVPDPAVADMAPEQVVVETVTPLIAPADVRLPVPRPIKVATTHPAARPAIRVRSKPAVRPARVARKPAHTTASPAATPPAPDPISALFGATRASGSAKN
jgi:hypothetical protein